MMIEIPAVAFPDFFITTPEVVYIPDVDRKWYACTACSGCGGRMSDTTSCARWWETCWFCGGKGGQVGF